MLGGRRDIPVRLSTSHNEQCCQVFGLGQFRYVVVQSVIPPRHYGIGSSGPWSSGSRTAPSVGSPYTCLTTVAHVNSRALARAPSCTARSVSGWSARIFIASASAATNCCRPRRAVVTAMPEFSVTSTPGPPRSKHTTGKPYDIASRTTPPLESWRLGKRRTWWLRYMEPS